MGCILVPVMTAAFRGLRPELIPQASTSLRIMQQLGGSFGSAVLFIIVQRQITDRAQAALGHPGAAGLAEAFGATFWWMLAFTAVLLLPVLFLPGRTKPARGR
jgi:hypothetical protein